MKEITKKLIARQNLSEVESYDLFSQFFDVPVEQQAAILALLAAKGETLEELLGARAFLIEHTDRVMINHPYNMIDIVGTGGDDLGTFNISTAASMVIASCGAYVAKHGGSSVTSQSGSSDVISHLGVPIYHSCEKIIESLTKNHYAYLSAPLFNKLLTNVKSLRKNLGFPSIFNILGPLINPVHPKRQVIGVYRHDLVRTVVQLLYQMGSQHALVVHSEDGLDEISISAPTYVAELKNGCITEYRITPESVGLSTSKLEEILGGTPADNALMIQNIFSGMITGPKLEVVLMNAAAGLLVSGLVNDLRSGVEMARLSIQSGKTSHFLRTLNVGHLDFCDIFNKTDHASIIAEIKFSSPSCAVIYQGELNHVEIAKAYLDNGACALSVLTEPNDFNGHIQYIRDIRNAFPAALILMKDFISTKKRIAQALEYGANAVLLIVGFLEQQLLTTLYDYAVSLGLRVIVEVHDLKELERALQINPIIIAINNRNLNTLTVDLEIAKSLMHFVPEHIHIICASGISTQQHIQDMQKLGCHTVLIGSHLMRSNHPGVALKMLRGEP